jgi:hypothetical protein
MKRKKLIIFLFVIFLLAGALILATTNPVFFYAENTQKVSVDTERIKADVYRLCHNPKPRNFENTASLNEAADYIRNEFGKLGLDVEEQKYLVNGIEYKNLICSFGPENAERRIVGAHYDVCYDQPGADDNASGVAGLLEIARLLAAEKPALKYRIDLVAYTLEEPPFFRSENMGSFVHARWLNDNGVKVNSMLCLEMIGYFSEEENSQEFPVDLLKLFYPDKGNFIAVVGDFGQMGLTRKVKKLIEEGSDIDVRSVNGASSIVPGLDLSDHRSYWKFGYPAVMIGNTAFFRNHNYHQPTDTPETLDYVKMGEVIRGVYYAVVNME